MIVSQSKGHWETIYHTRQQAQVVEGKNSNSRDLEFDLACFPVIQKSIKGLQETDLVKTCL